MDSAPLVALREQSRNAWDMCVDAAPPGKSTLAAQARETALAAWNKAIRYVESGRWTLAAEQIKEARWIAVVWIGDRWELEALITIQRGAKLDRT